MYFIFFRVMKRRPRQFLKPSKHTYKEQGIQYKPRALPLSVLVYRSKPLLPPLGGLALSAVARGDKETELITLF